MIEVYPEVVSEQAVLAALREVSDPELDESLVDLGFLESVRVDGGRVEVVLRLPTFWCAPNFAYLMAHDVREQTLRVPGVRQVRVVLKDHMYADEITEGVSANQPFDAIFPGQADGDHLDDLRALFSGKAFGMRQEQLVRFLLEAGLTDEDVVGLRLDDVLDITDLSGLCLRVGGAERLLRGGAALARTYLARRGRVGLDAHGSARLVTDLAGAPIAPGGLAAHLDRTRRQRVSMTFNAIMCRGLLETRYGLNTDKEGGSNVKRREAT
ncbi:MAG TPA: iron-sulfur cluster assembly protein [Candidatus Dormibacteraeota bacterium]|nr:iron-sulfur cluster assembly protein [Candidatus Dormibacteraeota bacterium]